MSIRSILIPIVIIAPLCGYTQNANRSSIDSFEQTFSIEVGAFYPAVTTEAYLNSPGGMGTVVDFEDDLEFSDRESVFEATATWRFSDRWSIQSDYVDLARTSSGTFEKDITWGDKNFEVDGMYNAKFDVLVARLGITYEIFEREAWTVGLTVGVHMTEMTAAIATPTSINSTVIFEESATASTGGLFPLPNFGLSYFHMLSQNWMLSSRLDLFFIQIDDLAGELLSGEVAVRYLFGENTRWGIGAGYKFFSLDVEYDRSDWNGGANITYHGPKVFTSVSW